MYSRSAKGREKGDPNRNPWLAKMLYHMVTTKIKCIKKVYKYGSKTVALLWKEMFCYFELFLYRRKGFL